jgi:hypothetical protein
VAGLGEAASPVDRSSEDRYFRELEERDAVVARMAGRGSGLLNSSADGRLVR